jgi:hypothetical protein
MRESSAKAASLAVSIIRPEGRPGAHAPRFDRSNETKPDKKRVYGNRSFRSGTFEGSQRVRPYLETPHSRHANDISALKTQNFAGAKPREHAD